MSHIPSSPSVTDRFLEVTIGRQSGEGSHVKYLILEKGTLLDDGGTFVPERCSRVHSRILLLGGSFISERIKVEGGKG